MELSTGRTFAICDAHHHLWSAADSPFASSDYLVRELRADILAEPRVVKTVFVECGVGYRTTGPDSHRPVGETEWIVRQGAEDLIQGIVGFADLSLGAAVDDVLEAHEEAAGGRFRGVRYSTAWDRSPFVPNAITDPRPELMLSRAFMEGVAALGRRGLSFDAWAYFHQLPEVAVLARENPAVTIVLNHFGGPLCFGPYEARFAEVDALWEQSMVELASYDNVIVKLGGIGMGLLSGRRINGSPSQMATAWRRRFGRVIELFGVDRCMVESNFPVDARSCTYSDLWHAFFRMSRDLSDAEWKAIFHDTAVRVYRLDDRTESGP